MAAVQPLPGAAYVKVEVDFASNWNNPTSFTDVTADVRFGNLSWERGRNDEYQTVSPGQASFVLDNRTRTYDPTLSSNIVPARPMRITCYYPTTATAYQQFDGMVEDWTPSWTVDHDSVVEAGVVERWAALPFCAIRLVTYAPTSDVRVRLGQTADSVGWPTGLRDFAAGTYQLLSQTYTDTDAMAIMQETANTQNQVLYQTRTGNLKTFGTFSTVGSSLGTFGDGIGELAFAGVADGVGGGYLYTQVKLTVGGAQWVSGQPNVVTGNVGGSYTIAKFGTRVLERTVGAIGQANAPTLLGLITTAISGQPFYRIKSITINPLSDPANIFPVVLTADLGNPITVTWQPPGGGSRISQTGVIRSIRHEISTGGWIVTWNLSP